MECEKDREPCANLPAGVTPTGHTVKGGCVGGAGAERWTLKGQVMAEERVGKTKSQCANFSGWHDTH